MTIEYTLTNALELAPDEVGVITGTQYAAVRLTRASGAAVSMFGFTACAFAMEADSSPTLTADMQTIEGWHTVSCSKADLLTDGSLDLDKVAALKDRAYKGALEDMLAKVAAEAAYNELGT